MRRLALAMLLVALSVGAAQARPAEVERALPRAEQVGAARYHLLGWTQFDAALWADGGRFSWDERFALALTYQRRFSANALANRSIAEMASRSGRGEAELEALRAPLRACFADVAPGDRITGVSEGPDRARFFLNGVQRCELAWPQFRRSFFGIWLAGRGRDAGFTQRLLGG